jgi:cytochrome c oxidase accessory protein FixG
VLWPQDFIYLAALLIICAYLLFLATAVAGRVWCGFACPQTVYTEIFLWIERRIEGKRSARIRCSTASRHRCPNSPRKRRQAPGLGRGGAVDRLYLCRLFHADQAAGHGSGHAHLWPVGMVLGVVLRLATYGNAGWMREQVCKYMCPYARFQSAMFDRDTLIITYDAQRGEPRGPLSKTANGNGGACIDCSMCVQVCPTGIDIRKGLQYECIGCAACVDACNGVMDKIGQPRGLIRYSTERAMDEHFTPTEIRRRTMRTRVKIYTGGLLLIMAATSAALYLRVPLKLDVIRDRGAMGREVEEGMIENVYRLQIMNTSEQAHTYRIVVSGIDTLSQVTPDLVRVGATETRGHPIRLRTAHGAGRPGSNKITVELTAVDDTSLHVKEAAVFFVPASNQ